MTPGAATSEAGVATKSLAPRTLPATKEGSQGNLGSLQFYQLGLRLNMVSCTDFFIDIIFPLLFIVSALLIIPPVVL